MMRGESMGLCSPMIYGVRCDVLSDLDLMLPIKVFAVVGLIVGCCVGAAVVRYGPSVLQAFKGWVAGL